jgi:hypothetical protein
LFWFLLFNLLWYPLFIVFRTLNAAFQFSIFACGKIIVAA